MHPDNIGQQFGTSEYFRKVAEGTHPPAMFATAREIFKHTYPGDLDAPYSSSNSQGDTEDHWYEDEDHMWDHKYHDKPGLTKDLKANGYDWSKNEEPVTLRDDTLQNGHHRIAALTKHRPDEFLPINTER
ncbi:hypothetical protein UFOVP45_125 [uncultured Caudovirales phage]|uniref:Uncharacterized protein n=1 Tax=uncultured Caudovirales phage TaxID=2100421 RepID=A0A6J5KNR2_9CAUD|nr:hypothetical protein UFOVP45_125 [uncultured Caudovirales phage]